MSSISLHLPPLESLPPSNPNLMPFHLDYTGPAPISTYFLPRPVPSSSTSDDPEAGSSKDRMIAEFRGRRMVGEPLHLPQGYSGVVFIAPANPSISSATSSIPPKREMEDEVDLGRTTRSGRNNGTQTRTMKRKREVVKFSLDSDSSDQEQEQQPDHVDQDDVSMEPSQEQEDEGVVLRSPVLETSIEPALEGPTRTLTAQARFDSIRLWNPDGPVDETRDEYHRGLNEWMRVRELLHAD